MHIGFTGTRTGMSSSQIKQLHAVLGWFRAAAWLDPHTFHYGTHATVELKADAMAARLAAAQGYRLKDWPARAGTELQRDREQVAANDILIAAPLRDREYRCGTWTTVHYAREKGIPVVLLARGR